MKKAFTRLLSALIFLTICLNQVMAQANKANRQSILKGYAPVNGLKMYYEIHGQGKPLLLLHGAYMSIEGPFRDLIKEYSDSFKVIVPEFQGHGRTADINREITYEYLADDIYELVKYLRLDSVDIFGYSMGSGAAMQVGIRHPEIVKKMVLVSGSYSSDGLQPAFIPLVPQIVPEMFAGSPFKNQYDSLAPNRDKFPVLVSKLKKLDLQAFNWEKDYVNMKKPLLLVFGDADIVTIDHIKDMFKKQGGNVAGDLQPLPQVQLLILPGTSHLGMMGRLGEIDRYVKEFL